MADVNTCCIIRVEVSGDDQRKKFDNQFPKTIATVLRLVEPWFLSGRTVIANSWFGSPTMVRALKSYGFYSIMQVKKNRYWPRGMPANDMVQSLGAAYGSVHVMKSLTDSVFLASLQDKKPKCVIANAGSTCSGGTVKRWINGRIETFARPPVFEEYEAGKGAVDTANNRRDNMPLFHDDVMKTYRWEMRLE
ncbi:hypothetical protein MUCCIDRAFT_104672 [Mucor lusitanicus CBS 277.49]|uniref:PiggyBac transposable element-derived protein domain-containing protein n=1 Tax=Mucor lusitanicus CBS 277.49 TaxID=747725 RepID=A0A168PH87_MUCCL|nr:hypothetical protein MUCCIDRAFT_104672 [Mucor lusitanicus CBS 277.49]